MKSKDKELSHEELLEENRMLLEEVRVARRASEITANLVVEQFIKIEEILIELEEKVAEEKSLRTRLAEKLTEAEEREEELAEARTLAEEANEAKSAFLASTSHELRTPLTSVLGFARIIEKKLNEVLLPLVNTEDKKVKKAVQQVSGNISIIVSEGERLTKLINNVLDLSKIESGKMEWKMSPLYISEVIERATKATESLVEGSPVDLIIDVPRDLPQINADKDQLIQVVVNLISNAVKFTEKGSVKCRARQADQEILVEVQDTGLGIPAEEKESIFEKFTQIGDTLTNKPKGTGLGLTICKEIIKQHGGRIWVQSVLGEGTTVSFALPVMAEKQSTLYQQKDDEPKQTRMPVESLVTRLDLKNLDSRELNGKKNILVVDDEKNIRELLRQELEFMGHKVLEAADGLEAINKVKEKKPELIILDVMMPEMSGFDVAAVLKNDPWTQDIPIIILSIVADRERGYKIGVDKYFIKPVEMPKLLEDVQNLLSQGKSSKQVLVAEEEEKTLNTVCDMLKMNGYQVIRALSAQECIKKAVELEPDMVIVDAQYSKKHDLVRTLRCEKGLDNIHFILLDEKTKDSQGQKQN